MTLRGDPRLEGHSFGVKGKALALLIMLTVVVTLAYDPDWFRGEPQGLKPFNPDNVETLTSAFKDLETLNLDSAKATLQPLVEAGDPDGLYLMASTNCVEKWLEEKLECKDNDAAIILFRKAAESGHAGAQLSLAQILLTDLFDLDLSPEEYVETLNNEGAEGQDWLDRSAEQGVLEAELNQLIVRLFAGTFRTEDLKKARLLSEKGYLIATQVRGGVLSFGAPGFSGPWSIKNGWDELEKAAEQGLLGVEIYTQILVATRRVNNSKEKKLHWVAMTDLLGLGDEIAEHRERLHDGLKQEVIEEAALWAETHLESMISDQSTPFGKAATWCRNNEPDDMDCLTEAIWDDQFCFYPAYPYTPQDDYRDSPRYDLCRAYFREIALRDAN